MREEHLKGRTSTVEQGFARTLWWMRYAMLVPVVFSMLLAFAAMYVATVDALSILGQLGAYAAETLSAHGHSSLHATLIATIIQATDVYLISGIFLIFAMGLYELFISPIEVAQRSPLAERLLVVHDLDDLKNRLAKMALLVLIIEVLRQALDLLYLAIAAALVGGAIWLSNLGHHRQGAGDTPLDGGSLHSLDDA